MFILSGEFTSARNVASMESNIARSASVSGSTTAISSASSLKLIVWLAYCLKIVLNRGSIVRSVLVLPGRVRLLGRIFWTVTNMMSWFGAAVADIIWVEGTLDLGVRTTLCLPELTASATLVIAIPLVGPKTAPALASCAARPPRTSS